MSGLYTVFGLGLACGLFLSWVLDTFKARKALTQSFRPAPMPVSKPEPRVVPPEDGSPRVFVTVNGEVRHRVLESDIPGLTSELGIPEPSAASEAFQNGNPVQIGNNIYCLIVQ